MEVSLRPETLLTIGSIHLTNSFLTSIFTTFLLLSVFFIASKRLHLIPNISQNIIEVTVETLLHFNRQLAGAQTAKIFPWFASFFFFILVANLIGLLPGFGTLGFFEEKAGHKVFIPLLRPVNSDLNMTLGLALVSLTATHILSVKTLGLVEYLSRFFSINPINLFVGVLELVSEFTKIVSLSFRLFGNIFAGEAVLSTISKLFAFILPLPFLILEVVVGFVQALIFSILTLVFMVILTISHKAQEQEGR